MYALCRVLCALLLVAISEVGAQGTRLDSLKRTWKTGESEILSGCRSMACLSAVMGRGSLRCARGSDSCVVRGDEGIYAWACADRSSGLDSLEGLAPELLRPIRERRRIEDSAVAWEEASFRTCADLGQDTIYAYEQVWANGRVERVRLSKSHFRRIEPPGAGHAGWVFYRNDVKCFLDSPSALLILGGDDEDVFVPRQTPDWSKDPEDLTEKGDLPGRWEWVPLRVLQRIPVFPSKNARREAKEKAVSRRDSLEIRCPGAVQIGVGRINAPLRLEPLRTELLQRLKDRRPGDTTRLTLPNADGILVAVRGKGAWFEHQRVGMKNIYDQTRAPFCYDRSRLWELVVLPGTRSFTLVGTDFYGFVDSVKVRLPSGGKRKTSR